MQALILAGGEGTRLRPLTSTFPKPVVPLVGRPFISYMIEWLTRHGVEEVILGCGFMADSVRSVLGDGAAHGVRLRYLEEPSPLGTGGALKFAEEWLEERFFMLNGDVLTDIDLTAQLAQHDSTGARGTLALIPVDDPSAYGLVPLGDDGSVKAFLEKPSSDQVLETNFVNAGAYILQREILNGMPPAGTTVSIERDVFPTLVGDGLFGYVAGGYWLDIGTPARYLQATYDILEGEVETVIGARLAEAGLRLIEGASIAGRVLPPMLAGPGAHVAEHAVVAGRTVLGRDVTIGPGAHVDSSVVLDGSTVGARTVINGSIIGPGVTIGEHCHIDGGVVIGAGAGIGPDNVLTAGARIFPGVQLPKGAIKF